MQVKKRDLFDHPHEQVGCEYISDLPRVAKQNPKIIIHSLSTIRPSDYPLSQWNDALNYLFKAPAQETAEAAYALLIFALSDADTVR